MLNLSEDTFHCSGLIHLVQKPMCPRLSQFIESLVSLVAFIGLGVSFWTVFEAFNLIPCWANSLQIAQSDTNRLTLEIERQPNEAYESLVRRARNTAIAITQQTFGSDPQASKVVIMVMAQNSGLIAPILTLEVSRNQWENQSQPQRWVTYFTSSRFLLGFDNFEPARENVPSYNPNFLPPSALPPEPPGSPL